MQKGFIFQIKASVRRNIEGFPLGPGLTKDQRLQILDDVKQACHSLVNIDEELNGKFYEFEKKISDKEREKLKDILFEIESDFQKMCKLH